jgi:hypothetical protein
MADWESLDRELCSPRLLELQRVFITATWCGGKPWRIDAKTLSWEESIRRCLSRLHAKGLLGTTIEAAVVAKTVFPSGQ